jgi:hypothetical protein
MEERNVGTIEQAVRTVGGSLASLAGIILLVPGKASLALGTVGVVLAIAGLYLFVTGSAGYCPIYRHLGWNTQQVKGSRDDAHSNRGWLNRLGSEGRRQRWLMLLWCLSTTAVVAWIVHEVWGS